MNPRVKDGIKKRVAIVDKAIPLMQDFKTAAVLAFVLNDVTSLLSEVERLERENCYLRMICGNNLPPKPLHNVTS